ncbi:transglycosylase domain-containing protein [Dermacoccus nishinomiyaensis]|uniref:transglycosylase domain-containing protein n=1 Tax=Dermacoccus nishinomiyaensis TaxID=1274 RepID=UPI0021A58D47|nr:transglycosylase domain-containing protein [Dermacoccus nishinomiyaensis]MCT1605484.1 transglycosylase domain-containing protein [Dermacoccus nishinomiyaensis]
MVSESGSQRPLPKGGSRPSNGGGSSKASTSRADARGAQGASPAARRRRGSKKKSAHSLPFRIVRAVLLTLASLVLLAVLTFIGLYLFIDIPKANAQATQAVSVVYYADGKTEMGRFTTTNRDPVELNKVPIDVQHAFIAAEDRSFYSNRGVSPTGIARAFINDFTGDGGSQGGSTLTQQWVKNYFLTQDKTVTRKVKEVVISLKVDQEMSKDEILQAYLNNVYFGRGTYGIQAASQSYFHKDVSQLTTVEGAFLASVVNNPENMDPSVGPNSEQRANERMAYTLNGMVKMGWLTAEERNKAVMPKFYPRQPIKYADGPQGYVIASVRGELSRKLKLSQEDIDRGGLRITTTIDKRAQDAAVTAVEKHTPDTLLGKLHTGLVAERANDGGVVAMYGGADYDPVKSPYSDADQAMLQTASSMKLYTAIAALQHGKSVDTQYNGNNYLPIGAGKYVQNNQNESWGWQPISNMLAYSINTAFVRLNREIGPANTLEAAQASGMPKTLGGMNDTNILNVLGTGDSRVVDQATGYNTLNSGGVFHDRHLISTVKSFDGKYSYTVDTKGKRVYDKAIADDLTWALGKTGVYGTAAGAQDELGRAMASKTGTASGNKYLWFNGFTPGQITTSVGMYYSTDGKTAQPMQNLPGVTASDVYGAGLPRKVWVDFMDAALEGQKKTQLPKRSYYNENKPESASTSASPTPTKTYAAPSSAASQPYPEPTQSNVQPTQPDATDAPGPASSGSTAPDATLPASSSAAVSRETSPPQTAASSAAASGRASSGVSASR